MYYRAACRAFEAGASAKASIAQQESIVTDLQEQFGSFEESSDKQESLAIRIEDAESILGEKYGPALQGFAATHILCAAALEGHINGRAEFSLSSIAWHQFEKVSLQGKWLFFPWSQGLRGFDAGSEPYQSFSQLVKHRNKLVHYRTEREDWKPPGVPEFIERLGLTEEAAAGSLTAVRGMVTELAKQLNERRPHWVESEYENFFDVEFEK